MYQFRTIGDPDGLAKLVREYIEYKLYYYNLEEIRNKQILSGLSQSVEEGHISWQDLHTRKLVFNTLFEGHGEEEFHAVLKSLKDEPWFNADRIIFLNNVFGIFDPPIKSVSWTWNMVNHGNFLDYLKSLHINWESLPRDRYFVCLMRRRSNLRAMLLKQLLERYRPEEYQISYASMIDYTEFDQIAKVQIPILLDGPTFDQKQHQVDDHRIFSCVINVVAETSNQDLSYSWHSRFASEKTFKCFAWHQIPIWWTVPNFVNDVRSLGFDVFDDIMDNHSYDHEQDPGKRLTVLLATLDQAKSQIRDQGIDKFNAAMMPRFKKNYRLLVDLADQRLCHWPKIIQQIQNV
jgi:hypothetical protein